MTNQKFCTCCDELIVEAGHTYNSEDYCSAECIEHVQEEEQEYLDSYDVE